MSGIKTTRILFVSVVAVISEHEICGSKIGVKKALEREQKEIIAAGGSVVRGRGNSLNTFIGCQLIACKLDMPEVCMKSYCRMFDLQENWLTCK